MLATIMAAALQYIEEALEIGFDVGVRVTYRVPHSGLRGEMDDGRKLMLCKQRRDIGAIGKIVSDEFKASMRKQQVQTRVLQSWIIIGIQVIESDDAPPFREQLSRNMKANEARHPRY